MCHWVPAVPDWTRAHRAGQKASGSSHCPSACSNTAANHGVSVWSHRPQTLPWAIQKDRPNVSTTNPGALTWKKGQKHKTGKKKKSLREISQGSVRSMCLISYMKYELCMATLYLFSWTKAESGGLTVLTKPKFPRRITLPLWYGHLWHGEPQVGKATRGCATNPDPHWLLHDRTGEL